MDDRAGDAVLRIEGLVSGYGRLPVLDHVSLSVGDGSLTAVIGPNGAGKTTLVNSIVRTVDLMAGEIWFRDSKISDLETHEIAALGIGFVPQTAATFPTLTVQENLEMGCRFVPVSGRATEIEKVYTRFPRLAGRRRQRARTLSGGERQMLAIGSALIANPDLLILDEPVTGLSPQLCDEVVAGIAEINRQGKTVLWVVEENPQAVLGAADWVFVMEGGRVKDSTSAAALLAAPDFRQIFLGV